MTPLFAYSVAAVLGFLLGFLLGFRDGAKTVRRAWDAHNKKFPLRSLAPPEKDAP